MGRQAVLLLTIFVAGAVAGPLKYSGNQCARHCTESSKLRYDPGVYTYQYESDTITTMQGTTHDESRLHLRAQVDIEVISKCDLAMRIRRTTLEHSDPRDPSSRSPASNSREFRQSLEKNILRFSFQDGRIEDLCPKEDEESWVLNIKRGILSAFQNSMDNLEVTQSVTETDVAGKCAVEYQSLGKNWRSTITIKKTKDLMSCTERYNTETALQANPYGDQPIKSLPLVEGEEVCEQTFSSNILQSSSCTEKHRFRPFSRQSSGAITRSTQKLTFSSSHNSRFAGDDYSPNRENMLFNHEYQQTEDRRQASAEEALTNLCNSAREGIKAEVPRLFTRLVYNLRKLDLPQLTVISRRAQNVCKDRKLFNDAMAMVGTTSSIQFMKDLIERNEVSGSEVDFWFTSLAFLPKPTSEMIGVLIPLLDGKYEQAILGVSGLVHTYCRSNSNCGSVREVREAVRKLVSNLGESCYGRDPRKVILSLKAIGNIGQGSDAEFALRKCYQNPQIDTETRLAAIQAHRRFSCDISRDDLLKLYTNYKEDSELRIASYLAVMRCATPSTIVIIKETLEKEIVNQVGSFVWTHLLNIKESVNPLRREIKDIVSNLYLLNKYNTDIRKFSRAMEGSMFSENMNMGVHTDSNVIYSPDSYIPRSAMFNLTLDLFGSTVNLFEIGGRVEHLEQMVERLFGPKGYFSKGAVNDILNNWRQKRAVSDNKIEKMDGMFDAKSRYNQDPIGSMYLKIFGNEMWYSNIDSLNTNRDSFDLNTFLRELATEQDIEFSKSFMFLDATYVIPTGSGMPLRLAINGTASVGLKVGGKFDVRSLKQVDVRGKFQPSGAVEVSSLMTVDAGGAKTGLKMVATLHSSTWLDGLIEVRNGELARIQMNMPRDKMEFIDVQSRIFLLHAEQEKEQRGSLEGSTRLSSCSGRYTNKVFGFELCSEFIFPESNEREDVPLFPMNGAARGRIYARKTDRSLTSYNFEARSNKEKVRDEYIHNILLTLNTPGSSVDREVTLQLQLNQPEKSVSFKLRTPIKKLSATAKYSNMDIQKRFDVSVKVDDIEKFAIQSELRADRNANGGMYSPAVEVIGPNGRIFAVTGSAHIRYGQRYSGQLNVEGLTSKPVNLNANIDLKGKDKFEGQFGLSSPYLETNLEGYAQLSGSVSSKINLDYQFENARRESIEFVAKFRDLSASSLTKYSGTLSLQSTAMPQYTTAATWEMQSANGHIENTVNLNLGDGRRSRMHTINLQEILSYSGNLAENSAALTLKMQYPEKNINWALETKHENTDRSFSNRLTVQYSQGKKLTINTEGQMESNQVKGEIKVQYPGRESKLGFNANRKSSKEYSAALIAQWQRGHQLTAATNFKNLGDRSKMRYEADAEINLPRQRPISMSVALTAANYDYGLSGDLNFGRDRYTLNANYVNAGSLNHRVTMAFGMPGDIYTAEATVEGNRRRLNGNIDVKLSKYRRIAGTLRATNNEVSKSGSLEVAWDADRDPKSAIAIEAQLTTNDKYEGSFTIRTNGRRITGALVSSHEGNVLDGMFRTNHKMEVEWEPNKKASMELKVDAYLRGSRRQVAGSLSVVTPFDNYENTIFLINHNDNRKEWSSNADLKFARNKQLAINTEGKYLTDRYGRYLNADLKISTHYRNFERINANIQYRRSQYDLDTGGKVEWGYDKKIAIGLSGSLVPDSSYKVGFNITSHYEMARQISTNAMFAQTSEGFRSQADAQWDINKKVSATIDAKRSLSRNKNTYELTAQINTPFSEYENIFSKNTYTSDRRTENIETETMWGYKKITGKASFSLRSIKDLEAKILFTTPFRNFELFDATLSHFSDQQKCKTSLEIRHSRNLAPIVFQGEGKWISTADAEVKLLFTSSFENFKRISSDIVHRMSQSDIRTVAELVYGDKKFSGELSGSHVGSDRAYKTEVYFQATTPFRGYEEIKASLVNNRREYNFLTILQGTLNRDVSKVQNNFKMDNYLNFEEHLQVISPYIRNVQVTIKQQLNEGNLKHDTEARWGRNQKLEIEVEHTDKSARNGKSFETKLKAKTPFESLRAVNVEGSYETNGRSYNPKIIIQWNDSKKISLEGTLTNNKLKQVEAQGTFTSPFYGYEYFSASGKYDVVSQRKTAEISMKWDPRNNKQIDAKGFVATDKNRGRVELNIVTPFREYETMILNGNYALRPEEKSATLQYQWGWKRITVNANHKTTENGAEVSLSFNSPYESIKQLSFTLGYKFGDNVISQMTNLQWNDKSILLGAELLRDGPRASLKITFKSPFKHYENVMFEIKGDLYSSRKSLDAFLQWDVTKKYELAALYEPKGYSNKVIHITVRTPYREYEEIELRADYTPTDYETKGAIALQWPRKKISLDAILIQKDGYPNSFTLNIDSPFSPFKNVRFSANVISYEKETFEVNSKLEWENVNNIEMTVSAKNKNNRYFETKMRLITSFKDFQEGGVEGSIANDKNYLHGKLNIVTPFRTLRNLDLIGSYQKSANGFNYRLTLTADVPEKKLDITGSYDNRNLNPVEIKLNVNAPFTSFKTFSINALINNEGWYSTDGQVTFEKGGDKHFGSFRFRNLNKELESEVKLDSNYIYWKTVHVVYKLNFADSRNIEGILLAETPNHMHRVNLNIRNGKRDFEGVLKLDSPRILVDGAITSIVSYSTRRNRMEAKASVSDLKSSHAFQVSYNNDNNKEISTQLLLKSDKLSFRSLDVNAKFINSNDRVMEAVVTATTPYSLHTVEGNLKNYDSEKAAQIKIDTPLLQSRSLIITGSTRSDNYRSMEGSLTVATPSQEIRVSGNLKRNGWEDLEAFITINTPFEALRMLRVDTKFLNDNNQNIEGNLEIQSSNNNMRKLGVSGKLHRSHGTDDLSITFRLPSRDYSTVGLLAIVHYTPDFNTFSPRITVSLPGKRYSGYANYEYKNSETNAGLACEWGEQNKAEIAGSLKRENGGYSVKVTVNTPFRNFKSQELSASYNQDRNRHTVGVTYRNARNDLLNVRGHLGYHNSANFNAELNIATPYKDFEDMVIRMRQAYRRNRLATSLDCTWSSYKKVGFSLGNEYSDTNITGHLYMTSSFDVLRSLKMNYAVDRNYYNKMCRTELEYNNKPLFKSESSSVYDQSTRSYKRSVAVDLPSLPLAVSLSFVPLPSGAETTLKTNYPTRSVSLHSAYQLTDDQFSHSAELSWDERLRRTLSYEIRIADTQSSTKEIYARLNLPIRSFELRGKHTVVPKGCNGELDFYWDVARDQQKHLMVKLEHEDESNWQITSHNVKVTVSHPRLSKDIVATGKFSLSQNDAFGKVELEYSRYQQHNMMTEIRARNLARRNRDTHYAVYITARHPISNTDLRLTGEAINTNQEASTSLKINYLDRQRQQRLEELKAKILKLKEQIDFIAKSDEKQLRLTGRMFNRDNEFTLSLQEQQNNSPPVNSHFRLSRRHLNMDLNITTPDQNNLHIKAAMPQDSVHFEITHINGGRPISDAVFHLGLKNSQILRSRLIWRPQIWQEIKESVSHKYNEASDVVIVTKDKIYAEISNELNYKMNVIGQAMSRETESFKSEVSSDMDRLRYDFSTMNNDIYDAYGRNEFYAKSAADAMGTAYEFVGECTDVAMSKVADGMRNVAGCVSDAYDYAKNSAADYYRYTTRVYRDLGRRVSRVTERAWRSIRTSVNYWAEAAYDRIYQFLEDFGNFVYETITKYAPFLETYYHDYKLKIQQFYQEAVDFGSALMDTIYNNAYYQAAVEYYHRILSTIDEFQRLSFYEHFDRATDAAYDYIIDYVEIGQRFHDEYLREIYIRIYERGSQAYRYLGLDTAFNTVATATYQKIKSLALDSLQECIDEFMSLKTGVKYEFEPYNGKIMLEVPLPSPKSSLREALDITTYPEYQRLSELNEAYLSGEDYCVWDTYYKYKRYFEDSLKLPPFDTYATVAGNQHYITFDKFHFDFAGECSYLLARDFVDGNFTVSVNYARDGRDVVRRSLTVFADNKKIDIGSDYKVTVNDAKVELPQIIGDSSITREGSVVTVKNERGFAIRCNFIHDLCTMHMSGFYFGKTGGLFGTYDYEPQLDMMTPERVLVNDVDTFANSWEVDGAGCRKEQNMAVMMNNDYRAKEACKKLFDDKDSIFRPCFKMVEPMRYYEMCMRDLSRYDSSMFDEKVCTSSAAYMTECNVAGVPVRMPKSCVRCSKYDGSIMNSGDVVKITQADQVQSADVVFIVEKKACNKDSVKMLEKLAQSIEDSLRQEGYTNTRYAVVGFGGDDIFKAPHLQTSDGQEFGNIRSIGSAFRGMAASGWSTDDRRANSVFEAIRYSASLPFRTGSTKSFVLLKCSECKAEEVKADYSEMLRTLLDGDITLHLLMEHEFEMKDNRTPRGKRVRVIGLDRRVAYTSKDTRDPELSGDRDLLAQMKIPKDFCVPLALEVNGSLFASQMLTETKRSMYKKFTDIMSRRLAKTAKPSDCQVCECISTPDGIGKSVCQRCVSPIVADMISPDFMYTSDVPYNNNEDIEVEDRRNKKSKGKIRQKSKE